MPHYDTTLSSKGRLTLPAGIRLGLQVEAGDTITWIDTGEHPALETWQFRVRIIHRENAKVGLPEDAGILRDYVRDRPVLTIDEMDEAVEQSVIDEYDRELREAAENPTPFYAESEPRLLPSVSTRITTKGQITMPKSYRRKYNVQEGDAVVLNDEIGHLSVARAEDILARVAGSLSAYADTGPIEIDRTHIWSGIATERDERVREQLAE